MSRAFAYSILLLIVTGSCLLEYGGARWLGSLSRARQNQLAVFLFGAGALAVARWHPSIILTNGVVLLAALLAGAFLSRQIGTAGALATMLMVAAIVDLLSAYAGPSRWLIDQARRGHTGYALQYLAVSWKLKDRVVPVIGISDLMFFTLAVSVVRRLGWHEMPALLVPLGALLSALVVGLWAGFTPALPFLAAGVLLMSRQAGADVN
jgi:hypothetical protein